MRRAELVAALSLAVDLGLGLPSEHVLRQTRIALRIAELAAVPARAREQAYHVSLLAWVGCTADSHELAVLFGDDLATRADSYEVDRAGDAFTAFVMGRLTDDARRGATALAEPTDAARMPAVQAIYVSHCEATSEVAGRLGLEDTVGEALACSFERWDGRGSPGHRAGRAVPLATRIVQLADVLEVHHRRGGVAAALAVVRARRGTQFDPALVDVVLADPDAVLADLDRTDSWAAVIAADPALADDLDDAEVDVVLAALGDLADLKSPFLLGHSRGVAALASSAADVLGMVDEDVTTVRRAGLVHDVGRIGVSSAVWDRAGPLSIAERERVHAHPFLTLRCLQRPAALAPIARIAGMHHERLDGSGYPSGRRGDEIPPLARLLAAADAYHAMTEERPHRPALSADCARAALRDEAAAGRLEVAASEAVLEAAGHRGRVRPERPGGLTPRQVEVLALLARGRSNRQIAEALVISPRTVGSHVEGIYQRLGVSNRASAALVALRLGVLPEPGVAPRRTRV